MAHPASRVLAMLELLQANRRMTGAVLASILAVDERTIRRYAGTLVDLGIPVVAARGRHGGYQLLPGFKLPPLMLTDDEAVAVVLALAAAERLGLTSPAGAAAESKIRRVLPAGLADRLAALRASLRFTQRPSSPSGDGPARSPIRVAEPPAHEESPSLLTGGSEKAGAIEDAGTPEAMNRGESGEREPGEEHRPGRVGRARGGVRDTPGRAGAAERDTPGLSAILLSLGAAVEGNRRLRLSYRDRSGVSSDRDFDPYGLVFHKAHWYAVGRDHRSAEVRSFRLDRIVTAEPTGSDFEPPPGFDAAAHLARQWAGLPWRWPVEVLIEGPADELRRYLPEWVADLTETPDGVLLRTRAEDLHGMARLLAGLGHPFTVLTPHELRTSLADHAARLAGYATRH